MAVEVDGVPFGPLCALGAESERAMRARGVIMTSMTVPMALRFPQSSSSSRSCVSDQGYCATAAAIAGVTCPRSRPITAGSSLGSVRHVVPSAIAPPA